MKILKNCKLQRPDIYFEKAPLGTYSTMYHVYYRGEGEFGNAFLSHSVCIYWKPSTLEFTQL